MISLGLVFISAEFSDLFHMWCVYAGQTQRLTVYLRMVTGVLTSVPYGLMADEHGPKTVLLLCICGISSTYAFYVAVCKSHHFNAHRIHFRSKASTLNARALLIVLVIPAKSSTDLGSSTDTPLGWWPEIFPVRITWLSSCFQLIG